MTEIATTKTFQDRMFERVRDQMGDLLTDEDLKKIVDTAVQKAFFEEQSMDRYGSKRPSVFVEYMQSELKSKMHTAMSDWLNANPEIVQQAIETVIKEGMYRSVISVLENRLSWPLQQFTEQLRQKGIFS